VRPKLVGCLQMAGISEPGVHKCPNGQILARMHNNRWSARSKPPKTSQFLQTTSVVVDTCQYEQISLQKECSNCPVTSIFGRLDKIEQRERKNDTVWIATSTTDGTLMWKEQDSLVEKCIEKFIEDGQGQLFKLNNETYRLSNSKKQIDLIISKTLDNINECNLTLMEDQYWVKGMPGVIVSVLTPEKDPNDFPPIPSSASSGSNQTSTTTTRRATLCIRIVHIISSVQFFHLCGKWFPSIYLISHLQVFPSFRYICYLAHIASQ